MQVHRCQFVDYIPQGVEAICFGPQEKKLAVARTNFVEIWDASDKRIEKVLGNMILFLLLIDNAL